MAILRVNLITNRVPLRAANWNHPLDTIYNATLSIRPLFNLATKLRERYTADENGNYIVNEFRINSGKVEGALQEFGAVTQMRIDFRSNLDNWILISEVNRIRGDLLALVFSFKFQSLKFQTFEKVLISVWNCKDS